MKIFVLIILIFSAFSTITFAQSKTVKSNLVEKSLNQNQSRQLDAPVKILYKPRAAYPNQDKGSVCIQGTVRLRVELLDTGSIGEIAVISGLPYGATENAIEAARNLKFEPARKNGKAIMVFKIIEFPFTIY